MTNTTISENPSPENDAQPPGSGTAPVSATAKPNLGLLKAGLRKARGIKKNFNRSQDRQVSILLYLYDHPTLSMAKIRSMFNLTKITSWRTMAQLKRTKFVGWVGSHKDGHYVITPEGKTFIEQGG